MAAPTYTLATVSKNPDGTYTIGNQPAGAYSFATGAVGAQSPTPFTNFGGSGGAATIIATGVSLTTARSLQSSSAVVANVLYGIEDSRWNAGNGDNLASVHGLGGTDFAPVGYGVVAGVWQLVSVDVAAGTYVPFADANQYVRGDSRGNIIVGLATTSNPGRILSTGIGNLILGGDDHLIDGTGDGNTLSGGSGNTIADGSQNTISGGGSNAIDGGTGNAIVGGSTSVIPASCSYVQLINCFNFTAPAGVSNATYVDNQPAGGPAGTPRDPYDVDTAKRKEVVDANVPTYAEADSDYYGKKFLNLVYGSLTPTVYECMPGAPAATGGATVWYWVRFDVL